MMSEITHYIKMLQDKDHNKRYEACEKLRVWDTTLPQEAIEALTIATNDTDPDVADAAIRALALHSPNTRTFQRVETSTGKAIIPQHLDKYYKLLSAFSWILYLPTLGVSGLALLGLGWSGGITEISSEDQLSMLWLLLSPIIGLILLMKAQNNYKNNNIDGAFFPSLAVILNSIFIIIYIVSQFQ